METMWREYGGVIISVIAGIGVVLLCILTFTQEREYMGEAMAQEMEHKGASPVLESAKKLAERAAPEVAYVSAQEQVQGRIEEGKKIHLKKFYQGRDVDGEALGKMEILDIQNEAGESLLDAYDSLGDWMVFETPGIYKIKMYVRDEQQVTNVRFLYLPVDAKRRFS